MSERHTILMCPPDHFSVDYVINPWMAGNEGALDQGRVWAQWRALHDELAKVADIELLHPQPNLPDLVFTANAGFVDGKRAVPSHFMPHERRPEEPYLKGWFSGRGFDLCVLPEDVGFEGAGDCLIDRAGPWMWTGYGFRTEIEAHAYLSKWFDREVVSVRLVDSRFYHIDTCLCPLDGGYMLYFPQAFDADSIKAIEARVPPDKRLFVSAEDAGNFACNAVNVDRHVFAHRFSDQLKTQLHDAGFEVHEVELTEFLKAGGSAKCLTLRLSEWEAANR